MRSALYSVLALTLGLGLIAAVTAADKEKDKTALKEAPVVPPRKGESETIKLFDGKDLEGWEGDKDRWSVQDGEIVGKAKEQKVSTYLLTKKTFSDFRLTAMGKLGTESETHSGFCFWGRKAPDHGDPYTYAGHLVMFPTGWGMYDLYGRESKLGVDAAPGVKAGAGKQHDWNHLEILAQGNRVRVAANGVAIIDWRDPEPDRIKEGPIGLQLHSNKMPEEVRFKDITVTTFPTEDKLLTVKDK
jgi:Domain of Unknown Function (DUF1080)